MRTARAPRSIVATSYDLARRLAVRHVAAEFGIRMKTAHPARRIVIAVIGGTVFLIGAMLLILPGPGILVVVVGLAILATEFAWARCLLRRAKETLHKPKEKT